MDLFSVAKPVEISASGASQTSPMREVSIRSVSQGVPKSNSDTLLTLESKPTVQIQPVTADSVASKPVNQPQPVFEGRVSYEPIANAAGTGVRSESVAIQGSAESVTTPYEVPVGESEPIQSPVQTTDLSRSSNGKVQDFSQPAEVVQQKISPTLGNSVTSSSEVATASENVVVDSSKVQTTQSQQQAETVAMKQDVRVTATEVSRQKVAFESISNQPKPEATVTAASETKPVVFCFSSINAQNSSRKCLNIGQKLASVSSKSAGSGGERYGGSPSGSSTGNDSPRIGKGGNYAGLKRSTG